MAAIESLTTDAIIALVNAGTWPPTFTLATADLVNISDVLSVDVSKSTNVVFHVKNNGSVADVLGVTAFEGSVDSTDGINGNWFPIQAARTNDNTIENGRAAGSLASGAAQAYGWEASVTGIQWFHVRQTTAVTPSAIMHWTLARSAEGSDPVPSVQTHPVTGSGTFTVATLAATTYNVISAATTNAALIAAGARIFAELAIFNNTAATIYVKLYNKATAPTVGTDNPVITIPVTAAGFLTFTSGFFGKRFPLGLGIAITGAAAVSDTTAVGAGAQVSITYV